MTLAAYAVVKLDARAGVAPRTLPSVAAIADSRAIKDSRTSERKLAGSPAQRFEGFAISDAVRDSIVRLAQAQIGKRYVFGGTTPKRGFDCSGFVKYVLAQVHLPLPRLAAQQARIGTSIERDRLKPGDLLAFGGTDSVSHIGIYVGDGKFVHASSTAGRVIVSPLNRRPSRLIRPLRDARRLLAVAEAGRPGAN